MDEEQTEATTGQPQATSPAASEATSTRDVARRVKKRGRGRPKGAKNKAKASTPTAPAPSSPAPSSSPAAIEGDDPDDEGGETAEGRSERYAEGRRAIADGAPAIARMLAPFAPAIGHGLDVAAGTPIASAALTIHHTTARGEPRTTTGTAADAVVVALSEAIAYLTPSAALATLDHPLAPALATVGGVAVAILGSRLAALLASLSAPAASSVEPSSVGDAASSPAPSSSAASDAIEVRDASTGAPLQ
jgi:hypothetical protein